MPGHFFRHPFTQLLTVIFIMITFYFVLFSLGLLLAVPLFGMSFGELSALLSQGTGFDDINVLKYFQSIQTLGLFVVPPFIAVRYFYHRPVMALGLRGTFTKGSLVAAVLMVWVAVPFINFLTQLNQEVHLPWFFEYLEEWLMEKEGTTKQMTRQLLQADTVGVLAINIFVIGLLPAVGEELLFRGLIQRIFTQWTRNAHWGIVIAAFLFSAMHIQFYGLIPRMFLGVMFGYLLLWSGSIWLPVIGHFVNNASAVVYYYFFDEGARFSSTHFDTMGVHFPLVLLSSLMILFCGYVIYISERRQTS